jgi:hypothetical protein
MIDMEQHLNLTDLGSVTLEDFTVWMRLNYESPLDLGNFLQYVKDYQKKYG